EERNIGRCLASLQDVVDEIIVVDSGSSDKTETICRQYGAQFIYQNWLGYGKQKNKALEYATSDYILSLDADEALSPQLKATLMALKNTTMLDAYQLTRLTNYCRQWIKHCRWYPDKKIRLWRKGQAIWTPPAVHETVQLADGAKLGTLTGDLLHYTYYSLTEHVAVANKYTTLVAKEYAKRGKKASWVKIFFSPLFCFFRDYFLRRGFLDG